MNTLTDSTHARATTILQQRLNESVSVEPDDLDRHGYDGLKIAFQADAVIRPYKESEVGTVLELANVFEVPVTTS